MHSQKEGLYPAGFECKPAPADPQREYNAMPLVRESVPTGVRQPVEYPTQVGGVTPKMQGERP